MAVRNRTEREYERRQGMTAAAWMGGVLVMYLVGAVNSVRGNGRRGR